jgi:hypothetical protein
VREFSCQEFVELVTAFLDGALDAQTERGFAEHLTECEGCGPYLEQFRQTISAIGQVAAEPIPSQVRNAILVAFRNPSA